MNEIKCLDHGFVKLRNISGPTRRVVEDITDLHDGISFRNFDADDVDPAQTARISFDNLDANRTREDDLRLYEYLIKNNHSSPIEFIEIWMEFKLPIFVARQTMRHRTFVYNEVSGRYATLPAEWYIPEIVGGKSKDKKQGQEDNVPLPIQADFKTSLQRQCKDSYDLYLYHLDQGVAPEHARMFLHLNHYTHYICKANLSNWMNFLALRLHEHAQIETRIYAQACYDLLKQYLPKSMDYFDKYRRIL